MKYTHILLLLTSLCAAEQQINNAALLKQIENHQQQTSNIYLSYIKKVPATTACKLGAIAASHYYGAPYGYMRQDFIPAALQESMKEVGLNKVFLHKDFDIKLPFGFHIPFAFEISTASLASAGYICANNREIFRDFSYENKQDITNLSTIIGILCNQFFTEHSSYNGTFSEWVFDPSIYAIASQQLRNRSPVESLAARLSFKITCKAAHAIAHKVNGTGKMELLLPADYHTRTATQNLMEHIIQNYIISRETYYFGIRRAFLFAQMLNHDKSKLRHSNCILHPNTNKSKLFQAVRSNMFDRRPTEATAEFIKEAQRDGC